MNDLALCNSTRRRNSRNQAKPHRNHPLHKHLDGLYNQLDVLRVGQVNWEDNIMKVAAHGRQLARICALKVLKRQVNTILVTPDELKPYRVYLIRPLIVPRVFLNVIHPNNDTPSLNLVLVIEALRCILHQRFS